MQLSCIEKLLCEFDRGLRTILPPHQRNCDRPNPGNHYTEPPLTPQQKQHIAGLMRVNHAGEVCAQALYQGQALTAKLDHLKTQMQQAAIEETDHLAWCEQRLAELGHQPSKLNILWYNSALWLGILAGLAGERISLGFVVATEQQVYAHLQRHCTQIQHYDPKTTAIITQMQHDELNHATIAHNAGASALPNFVQKIMHYAAKIMTTTSYYI